MTEATSNFWRDSRMPYVETRRACASRICYQAHSHPTFSIGAVDQGHSCFHSHQTGEQIITAKTLVLMPADVVHRCNPVPEQSWSYQMLHLDAAWLNTLLQEYRMNHPTLATPYMAPLQAQVIQDVALYQNFTELNDSLFNPELTIVEKEQRLVDMLIQLLEPTSVQTHSLVMPEIEQQQFVDVLNWLAQSEDFISLQDLATHLQISRFALIRLFKQQLGLAPHAYQINLRINQARELLRAGQALADVAFALGFCDQSHFHRSFKAYTGITPKQYQNVL
ncbi:AraC family transcriptional regulator [Acinetobacter rudis]|uniref:HTH araC/xylS-type domain-containing protein n=1 Tax=Acinetobacter rudis CIP 110305 TaxID=421052 RepID=S3NZF6_9GAMM|nr:AraC family transcriptional regulator [Acinetobacter rudis]EPF71986.1 hypothetical protein F945_02332 [Acinetobacter rudis CIP 110305]